MIYDIEIGCNASKIPNGHRPSMYKFRSNVWINIVGAYGIRSDGNCKSKRIKVILPDWIGPSQKYRWPLAVPGRQSKTGSADMAFVVCNRTAEQQVELFGECDQNKLIDDALASGLSLVYPDPNGDMQRMPVSQVVNDI